MKKLVISVIALAVIGIGFYIGYQKSGSTKMPGLSPVRSVNHSSSQLIKLSYKEDNSPRTGVSVSNNNSTHTIQGNITLGSLLDNVCMNDRTLGFNNYYLDVSPELQKKKYSLDLSFPANESIINVLNGIGQEMGFSTQVSETTIQVYQAVRNDKPSQFAKSNSFQMFAQGMPNNVYKFKGINYQGLFMQYKHAGLFIEDSTGNGERFDGELTIDKNNPEAMKAELGTKAGIDLLPYDKTIKLITIQ